MEGIPQPDWNKLADEEFKTIRRLIMDIEDYCDKGVDCDDFSQVMHMRNQILACMCYFSDRSYKREADGDNILNSIL